MRVTESDRMFQTSPITPVAAGYWNLVCTTKRRVFSTSYHFHDISIQSVDNNKKKQETLPEVHSIKTTACKKIMTHLMRDYAALSLFHSVDQKKKMDVGGNNHGW